MIMRRIFLPLAVSAGLVAQAQPGQQLLAHESSDLRAEELIDRELVIVDYEPLNRPLGGDSVRSCNGYACIGWVEDHYPDGTLRHRGYYDDGQLIHYRNYHPDGSLEREFRLVDNVRCLLRTYFPDGTLRTEARYHQGEVVAYADHHPNGQLRYDEERHKSLPVFVRMDLFSEDGTPVSTLHLEDRKRMVSVQREYHPNGTLRVEGRVQYDPARMDSRRIGTWTYRDAQGVPVYEEIYVDGKVHQVKDR